MGPTSFITLQVGTSGFFLKKKDSVHDLVNVSLFLMKKKKIEPPNLVKLGGKSSLLYIKKYF